MLIAEEALLFLLENKEKSKGGEKPSRLHVKLSQVGNEAEIEYVSTPSNINAESALMALSDVGEADAESELSLRLLRGMAKEVKHLQYHGTDYLLLRVDSSS